MRKLSGLLKIKDLFRNLGNSQYTKPLRILNSSQLSLLHLDQPCSLKTQQPSQWHLKHPQPHLEELWDVGWCWKRSFSAGFWNKIIMILGYLLLRGLSLIWMVLSSWMLPWRPTGMFEFGTLKVLLFLRVQQEKPWGEDDEEEDMEEERDTCFNRGTSLQLASNTFSSTNSWF